MTSLRRALPLTLVLLAVLAIYSVQQPARAASTFVVNSAADTQDSTCGTDPGGCTLPDAIAAANALGGADIIGFDPAVFPPNNSGPAIVLSMDLPAVNATDGITIDGTGAGVKISATSSINGLFVQSGNSVPAQNVTIRKIAFTDDVKNAVFICGGTLASCGTEAAQAVSNVTVENVSVNHAASYGINIWGAAFANISVKNNTISYAFLDSIGVGGHSQASNIDIASNTIVGAGSNAITFGAGGQALGVHIHDNQSSGGYYGIQYSAVGGHDSEISNNTVHDAGNAGIKVTNVPSSEDVHVTISRNSTYNNGGPGIDLGGDGVTPNDPGDADFGPNDLLNFPVITASDAQHVSGTACANCKIELFGSDNDPTGYGEGQTFIADTTADGAGNFAVQICNLSLTGGTSVTATATDSIGNTSEFSLNFSLTSPSGVCPTPSPTATHSPTPTASPTPTPTPSPTPTPHHKQGDLDCNGVVDGRDALRPLRYQAGVPMLIPHGCPNLIDLSPLFGDVNCDGSIDVGDAVTMLEHIDGLPLIPTPGPGCAAIGSVLS